MLNFKGRMIPETLEEVLDPKHTVLVIHDMQNDPCNPESVQSKMVGTYNCDRIMGKLLKLRDAARKAGVRVMYTQYTNQPDYQSVGDYSIYHDREFVGDPKNPNPVTNVVNTWGWEIVNELKPAPNEVSVLKYRIDCFVGTNFDNILRTNHIKTIVSSGIALEVGIDATARTAILKDYFVVVPRDVVAGRQQEYCDETMTWLERSVIVKNMDEITKVWESSKKSM
jgi:nicotinamidase-related amidase